MYTFKYYDHFGSFLVKEKPKFGIMTFKTHECFVYPFQRYDLTD